LEPAKPTLNTFLIGLIFYGNKRLVVPRTTKPAKKNFADFFNIVDYN
jgi:hypothetical protein